MSTKKIIFPVTRLHEPIRVDVEVEKGIVVKAWVSAQLFRGFELMLKERDPRDVVLFTQRICGICSCAHAIAAALAQQQAFQVTPTPTGQALQNLMFAADILQNHIRHFYLLVLPDYALSPHIPLSQKQPKELYHLPERENQEITSHIKDAIYMSTRAHEMLALWGGKAPHQQTILATGITEKATSDKLYAYRSILKEIHNWVKQVFIPDTLMIAEYYKEYYHIGQSGGNFLSFGMFPKLTTPERHFPSGFLQASTPLQPLDFHRIQEEVSYSWYEENDTLPALHKPNAYSWVKAPRYNGLPFEGGPLARAWISGTYRKGVATMDRIVARTYEVDAICQLAKNWLDEMMENTPTYKMYTPSDYGEGLGATDAMRGSLLHQLKVEKGKVKNYQIITPSTWNFSPRDQKGVPGPVEQALLGTPIADMDVMIEVGRIVRSFDPCFSCAVHCIPQKT